MYSRAWNTAEEVSRILPFCRQSGPFRLVRSLAFRLSASELGEQSGTTGLERDDYLGPIRLA